MRSSGEGLQLGAALAVAGFVLAFAPAPAVAQSAQASSGSIYVICSVRDQRTDAAGDSLEGVIHRSEIFVAADDYRSPELDTGGDAASAVSKEFADWVAANGGTRFSVDHYCHAAPFTDEGKQSLAVRRSNVMQDASNQVSNDRRLALRATGWQPQNIRRSSKKPDETLKSLTVRFPAGNNYTNGYIDASAEMKYRFIACMGELHVAYSLDAGSVRTNGQYTYNRKALSAGDVLPPKLSAVSFQAKVFQKTYGIAQHIGWVGDKFAGPALGFGCFSGQLQKVGILSKYVDPKTPPADLQAYLDETFSLGEGIILQEGPLRSAAVESKTDAEWDRLGVDRALRQSDANWAEVKAKADAELAERVAARKQFEADRARYEQSVRDAAAAKEKFERDMAAHEAERARARAAREEYERKLAEWKAQTGNE